MNLEQKILIIVFCILSFFFILKPSFAQTITPSASIDQSGAIAKDTITTTLSSSSAILTPNQQSLNNLPDPGLLPDSPFYFLKRWGENIQTFFTIDDYQRAQLQLRFAQQRLAEAAAELVKNNTKLTDAMLNDYNKNLQAVNAATQKLINEGKQVSGLIDTIKDREQVRLAILNNQLAKTTDPTQKQRIQNDINFTQRQSQTNINRLVQALTEKPNYLPNPNQTVSGSVTTLSSPNFTVQTPNGKTFTFTTDATTKFKTYNSTSPTTFSNLTVGIYTYVTFPRQIASVSGTLNSSSTQSANPSTPLAKTVVIGVPQSLIVPISGTIANFSPNGFTLKTDSAAVTITVDMNTAYHSNRQDANVGSIRDGTAVRVYAIPKGGTNTFLAKAIYIILPQKLSRTGTVSSIQGSTITVVTRDNSTYTFTLTSNTLVQKNAEPGSSTDIVQNALVTVWYFGNANDTIANALDINVHIPNASKIRSYRSTIIKQATQSGAFYNNATPSFTPSPTPVK